MLNLVHLHQKKRKEKGDVRRKLCSLVVLCVPLLGDEAEQRRWSDYDLRREASKCGLVGVQLTGGGELGPDPRKPLSFSLITVAQTSLQGTTLRVCIFTLIFSLAV